MLKNYDKRGSVLLMVVGLLVILGTLGGTFLLVSSLDARQSKLLAGRGRAEHIASGGVSKVVRILGEDLHFGPEKASAPYTAPNIDGDERYKNYIDHASVDGHLHVEGHFSNVFGFDQSKLDTFPLVSTEAEHDDSDAQEDAYLIPTGEFSDDGEEYHIAIKVSDMSSLLALNTGGEDYLKDNPDTSQVLKSPALIRLKEWMGGAYDKIHKSRCGINFGGTSKPITDYDIQCGRKLLSTEPQLKYMPFAIADEVYLRWLGSGRKANFGRVYDQIKNDSIGTNTQKRQMLTTINSSRSIVRNPITGVVSSRIDLSEADSLDSSGKDTLYAQIVLIAGSDDGLGGSAASGVTRILDDSNLGSGFYIGHPQWLPINGVQNAYKSNCRRYKKTKYVAWWVFDGLPQASYRVWASWGSPTLPPASNVPYVVYSGGQVTGNKYSGGTAKGMYVANQTELPSDANFSGAHWKTLGSHWAEGRLAVEIHGPQGVPPGETQWAFADAVRIEGVSLDLGSGSQPAAHLTANTWAAMSLREPDKAFAFRPQGKDYVVFGVQEQPFITEAFATHTTKTATTTNSPEGVPTTTVVDADAWKWGAAIELMNFSSEAIKLKDYKLIFGSSINGAEGYEFPDAAKWTIPAATDTSGGRLVLYDFDAGKDTVTAADVFGMEVNGWERVEGLNFDNQTIRLVRIAKDDDANKEYTIPVDHITAGGADSDLEYSQATEEVKNLPPPTDPENKTISETTLSNCRRDDSVTRARYSVAMYWKPEKPEVTVEENPNIAGSHMLGRDNVIGLTGTKSIPVSKLKEGFRIKLPHGLLSGPGALTDFYLAGPIIYDDDASPPADLPELLAKDFATKDSRGRANSHVENKEGLNVAPWNAYPRKPADRDKEFAWPLLLGEIIETVPMDIGRGDSPTRVYGRINVNTASKEVLELLPWPTGVNAGTAASKIITYRDDKKGFVTPGEVTLALDGMVANDAEGNPLDRDSIYAAISSCITVNSDMYAVNIRVQLGDSKTPLPNRAWYYLAVIDRGCAVFSTDKPAVLLFTQLK